MTAFDLTMPTMAPRRVSAMRLSVIRAVPAHATTDTAMPISALRTTLTLMIGRADTDHPSMMPAVGALSTTLPVTSCRITWSVHCRQRGAHDRFPGLRQIMEGKGCSASVRDRRTQHVRHMDKCGEPRSARTGCLSGTPAEIVA